MNNHSIPKRKKKIIELRVNRKMRSLVDELHWKSIKYLTDNYNTILIGDMSSESISNNKSSKLNKKTKRKSYGLSFYRFKERLKYKGSIKGNNILIIDESYTSKTCSFCSEIHSNLGSNKIFNCPCCDLLIDRDLNGALGILLKSLN